MPDNETECLPAHLRVFATRLGNALVALASEDPTMTAQLAMTFLAVAADEGLTVTALAVRSGLSASTMSRHVQDLGHTNRHGQPGLGLVGSARRPHGDAREYQVFLTDRGAALLRQMKINFEKGPTWRILPVRSTNTDGP